MEGNIEDIRVNLVQVFFSNEGTTSRNWCQSPSSFVPSLILIGVSHCSPCT